MKFNRDEYARQCRRVRNTPLYRATCPIADELDSLRDSAVEMIADDILDNAIADPDYIAEFILENDYYQEGLKEMCISLCAMMDAVINPSGENRITKALDSRMHFANAMQEFIEIKATSLAEEKVDD